MSKRFDGRFEGRAPRWIRPRDAALLLFTLLLAFASWSRAQAAGAPATPGSTSAAAPSGDDRPQRIVTAKIEGMIDLGLGPFVERVLTEAAATSAALVVFEINTFGGRVDAAVAIRDHLLASPVRTVAFVNRRAISAGALITLAAERIAMTPGGTIGAATPVQMSSEGASPVDEKTVSYVRKEFRATADARGRPGMLAEAMVDSDVVIEGVIEEGKLLTLTTDDALTHGIADLQAENLSDLLTKLGIQGADVREAKVNWAERVLRFLTQPVVASLLMTVGLLGLFVELRTPGVGIPGVVGAVCLLAFFGGHAIVELVGWEQVLLLLVGVILLIVEIFFLPGFGVAGVLGILALAAGLSTSLMGAGASLNAIILAVTRVAVSGIAALFAALALLRFLPRLPGGRRLILSTALGAGGAVGSAANAGDGREETETPSLVGLVGTSLTPLRPAGIALLEGRRVDVVSQGDFILPGETVEVVLHEGHRVVVRSRGAEESKGSLK